MSHTTLIATLCLTLSLLSGCVVADTALATDSEPPPLPETKASPEETQEAFPSKQVSESVVADNRTAPNEPAPEAQTPSAPKDEVPQNATSPGSPQETQLDLGMKFDVAPDVSPDDLRIIKQGFVDKQKFLDEEYLGGIPARMRANLTVMVVATGLGDQRGLQNKTTAGPCCTFGPVSDWEATIFIDTAHEDWVSKWDGWPTEPQQKVSAAHEYAHAWFWSLGCLTPDKMSVGASLNNTSLGAWLTEGVAEYLAYGMMVDRGVFAKDEVASFMKSSAIQTGEWQMPLKAMEGFWSPLWPGHIGEIRVEYGITLGGVSHLAIRDLCVAIANGATRDVAYQMAFNADWDISNTKFELWKPANTL